MIFLVRFISIHLMTVGTGASGLVSEVGLVTEVVLNRGSTVYRTKMAGLNWCVISEFYCTNVHIAYKIYADAQKWGHLLKPT